VTRIDVRAARRDDVHELSATLGRAFFDDPVMAWMLPNAGPRARKLPRIFATMTRHHHLAGGGVEVALGDAGIGAAALWDPPGRATASRLEEMLMIPGFIRAFGSRVAVAQAAQEAMHRVHPEEPHWYLAVIGSGPSVRGKGFGQALMRSRLDRVDAEHAPAYLESTKPDNVPYYQRFGFEVTGEIVLPNGGPSLWPMWRAAR
jgi:GNAT superfamily N-acetyltransferase